MLTYCCWLPHTSTLQQADSPVQSSTPRRWSACQVHRSHRKSPWGSCFPPQGEIGWSHELCLRKKKQRNLERNICERVMCMDKFLNWIQSSERVRNEKSVLILFTQTLDVRVLDPLINSDFLYFPRLRVQTPVCLVIRGRKIDARLSARRLAAWIIFRLAVTRLWKSSNRLWLELKDGGGVCQIFIARNLSKIVCRRVQLFQDVTLCYY